MRKQFTNKEILQYAEMLSNTFLKEESQSIELPIKVNFYLQKNIRTFIDAAELIDESRLAIGEKYGEYDVTEEAYKIKNIDNLKLAKQDLKNLFSLEQVLEIYMVSLEDLNNINLNVAQMNAMFFMIEE